MHAYDLRVFQLTMMDSTPISYEYMPLLGKTAEFARLSESGVPAHFYGANGFPSACYLNFLEPIRKNYELESLSLRACWPEIGKPPRQVNWQRYADDLIAFLDERNRGPIVGIGHSQGATATLMAAAMRPDLFQSIILIEPASIPKHLSKLAAMVPFSIKRTQEPVKSALARPDKWTSREAFVDWVHGYRAYRRLAESSIQNWADYGLRAQDGYLSNRFSKEWEAANYAKPQYVLDYVKEVFLPIKVIVGKPSLFLNPKMRNKWKAMSANTEWVEAYQYGHLFPLEAPDVCAEHVMG
ncbi:alpha/beta hydrolase [Pontibacter sp. G13]|uniref:alpha/beta fold hydrolase n=1 Tax=Pontibacter sp. G13 TaxID=3074898 RepID=UPI00288B6A28|nr:alpha/beta hydrolase [Pontibacter sp. G13]WNJ20497.1 alpha/beta hydrolase [Pontibacter sp. G13]